LGAVGAATEPSPAETSFSDLDGEALAERIGDCDSIVQPTSNEVETHTPACHVMVERYTRIKQVFVEFLFPEEK